MASLSKWCHDLNLNKFRLNIGTCLSLLIAFFTGVLFTLFYIGKPPLLFPIQIHSINRKSLLINSSRSIRPSSFDRCGTWQEDYIERHRAIFNGSLPPRYVVSVAVEAGLADRLAGTLTEFFLALLTNRAFQIITWGTLPRFEAAFLAPHINWSRPTDPDHLIDNVKYTFRGVRGYSGDRSYGPEINTSMYWPIFLMNNENDNAFFHTTNVSTYPFGHDHVITLFISSNRGRIVRIFDNPYHRSQLFRMGLRPETAARCVFDFLFSPTDALRQAMSNEFAALKDLDALKISINIRVGDHVFNPENDAKTPFALYEPYFKCASDIESFARVPNQRVIWYVTSDSLRIRQLAKERYGEKVLTQDKLRYFHGDCGDNDDKRYGNCTKSSQDSSIRMAAGQIYAMTMCDYHVISLMSGFGKIAAILANQWHNIYRVYFSNRSCTQTSYDSFEELTTSGGGL